MHTSILKLVCIQKEQLHILANHVVILSQVKYKVRYIKIYKMKL
jgi:hypothetical protein